MEKITAAPGGSAYYLALFGERTIACNRYVLARLGIDKNHCSLKCEDYVIACTPFQFGFKSSLFMAKLTRSEMVFFRRYVGSIVALSITFRPSGRLDQVNFFIRCTVTALTPAKGHENTGLLEVEFRPSPDEFIILLGSFLEHQERLRAMFDIYAGKQIVFTPDSVKRLGYTMQASLTEQGAPPRRIQLLSIDSKSLGHVEPADTPLRPPGAAVNYLLSFYKYRVSVAGKVESADRLPKGLVRTVSTLPFNPDLVEIIDDYWLGLPHPPPFAKGPPRAALVKAAASASPSSSKETK